MEFDAIDGRPVHALFTVVSATVPAHLRILSQLGFALHDEPLRELLSARAAEPAILARIREIEQRLARDDAGVARRTP